jgi:hypothetical protein
MRYDGRGGGGMMNERARKKERELSVRLKQRSKKRL